MFTPKSALFTFFAVCALGVVACQPVEVTTTAAASGGDSSASVAPSEASKAPPGR